MFPCQIFVSLKRARRMLIAAVFAGLKLELLQQAAFATQC
jgi:hypothetical protein